MRNFLKLVAILAFAASGQASYAALTFNLDTEFSGGANPAGSPPWVTGTFSQVDGDTVSLTINATGLSASEFITEFDFNFVPGPALNTLTFTDFSKTGTFDDPTINAGGVGGLLNQYKADGDGNYDLQFIFASGGMNPASHRFGDNEIFSLNINGTGILESGFNSGSVGGDKGSFFMAAHVQGIALTTCNDDSGLCDSGWIGAPIPEPEIYAMIGIGLALMGFVARRRQGQATAT